MKQKKFVRLASLAALGALLVTNSVTTSAFAGPGVVQPTQASKYRPIRVVDVHGPGVVHLSDGSVFYPTGPAPAGTLFVIPNEDGTLPSGFESSAAATQSGGVTAYASTACLGGTYIAPLNTWTNVLVGQNCQIYGTATGTASYWFGVAPGMPEAAFGQGLGYYQGYNGSTFGIWGKWYSLGTASDGVPGGGTVPWQNVAGNPKFMALGMSVFPATGNWGV